MSPYSPDAIIALVSTLRDKANSAILTLLSEAGIHDLLPAHGAVLNALFQHESLSMSDIARLIDRKKNSVTGLIETLVERGYCVKQTAQRDKRTQLVTLTAKGLAVKAHQQTVSTQLLSQVWHGIAAEDQDACVAVLHQIVVNLDTVSKNRSSS